MCTILIRILNDLCVVSLKMFQVRSSKFRHLYGSPSKKESWYEGIKVTTNAHDSNFCEVNPKFLAIVIESTGGGVFLVLPINQVSIYSLFFIFDEQLECNVIIIGTVFFLLICNLRLGHDIKYSVTFFAELNGKVRKLLDYVA